jgi:glycosyltransferase involved in cell wall biosynthesis
MISIIIIVKDDRGIEDTLNSLKKIKKPEKTEVIVVDASKKETLLDIRKKFPNVKWIYFQSKMDNKITISEQRNIGIKKARGDIITFIDANCTPLHE